LGNGAQIKDYSKKFLPSEASIREVILGRVVRKPVNANPGLKVNRGNDFSCKKCSSLLINNKVNKNPPLKVTKVK